MVYTPSTLHRDTPLREVAMPWLETDPMNERLTFVQDALSDRFTMAEVCARYGVSRPTGYKWIERHKEEGRRGRADRSRAPRTCPHALSPALTELLITTREAHPFWGARKLLAVLQAKHPRIRDWPAPSTVADLLARRGLVKQRRTRRPTTHPGVIPATAEDPNDLWTADFKGQFRTGNHVYCYPLTMADLASRYLLRCQGLLSTKCEVAKPIFERAFREFGLPRAIRSDNGVPFATAAIHGLSFLNVYWMQLGIAHQRIHPASPQENGAHERMHRTLKREAIKPVRQTCAAQQRNFDAFRREYNEERPHEALGQRTPASQYTPSPRPYPSRLPTPEYPGHFLVKRVTTGGTFRFGKRLLYLANALTNQPVGLEETDDGLWSIYFHTVLLATFDERDYIIQS
jgi:putative transposase